ncbi:tail fibers protein with depolymerase domain [Klebsiella phage PEA128]|nr:tail fibers protein with depolymerase domain [Klebsiella phage PEA128]
MDQDTKTIIQYPTGSDEYDIPFDYLSRKFVRVSLVSDTQRLLLDNITDYRYVSRTRVKLLVSTDWYSRVEIRRFTSASEMVVDFSDGSVLRATDLNVSALQSAHIAEEARDLFSTSLSIGQLSYFDAKGLQIKNVAQGVDNTDAATVQQLNKIIADVVTTIPDSVADNIRGLWARVLGDIGITLVDGSFESGATITTRTQALWSISGRKCYTWAGALPKVVPENSTPESTGGISETAWVDSSSKALGVLLAGPSGAERVGLKQGGTVQDAINWLTFDSFDIVKDGSQDVTADIMAACVVANDLGLDIKQNDGTYLVSGNPVWPVYNSLDLNGVTLKLAAGFSGYFALTQKDSTTVYGPTSPIVQAINAAGGRTAGSGVLEGLVNSTELNGKFLFMEGADVLYYSRGTAKYWWTNTYLSNRGKLSDNLKYGVSAITKITAVTPRTKIVYYRLPNLDFGNGPANNGVIRVLNNTRFIMQGGSISNRPLKDVSKSPVIISLNYCASFKAYDFFDPYPAFAVNANDSLVYSYTLNFNDIADAVFENFNSQGYGWGVVGGQRSTNITYRDCNLNRVDMHDPYMGYLKVLDTRLGTWGINASGMGDMYLERVTVDLDDSAHGGYREHEGIINARGDFGGFHDGGLYIKDLTIVGEASAFEAASGHPVALVSAYSFNASLAYIPESSPVTPWGFKEVIVEGLHCPFKRTGRRFNSIISAPSIQFTVYHPMRVKLEDCNFNSTAFEKFDLRGWRVTPYNPSKVGIANTLAFRPTNFVDVKDCSMVGLEFTRPTSAYDYSNFDVNLVNVKNVEEHSLSPFTLYTNQCGRYNLVGCGLQQIVDKSMTTGERANRRSTFSVTGGTWNSLSGNPTDITYGNGYDIPVVATGVMFVGPYSQTEVTDANLNVAEFVQASGCKFLSSGPTYIQPLLWSGAGGPTGASANFNVARGNTLGLNISAVNGETSQVIAATLMIPQGFSTGQASGTTYGFSVAKNINYQLGLNARSLKANVGLVRCSDTITGVYLNA